MQMDEALFKLTWFKDFNFLNGK